MNLRNLFLEHLTPLSNSQFDELMFVNLEQIYPDLKGHINVSGSTPKQRSMELIRFLEQKEHGLQELCKELGQPFTVPYAAIMELEELLRRIAIPEDPEDIVRHAFHVYLNTLGEQASWELPDYTARPIWDSLFPYLLDRSWMSSSGQNHLIHFVSHLASSTNQPVELKDWVRKTAKELGVTLPPEFTLPPGPPVEQSYLLLAVSPEGGYYTLHAWFMSHPDKSDRIYEKKLGNTVDKMPQYLKTILADPRVIEVCLAGKPPVLEFFLPINLLSFDLDQWKPPGEIRPLSAQYCLVVRAWERFGEQRWVPDWGRYWRQFKHTLSETASSPYTAWLTCPDGQCSTHFDKGRWVFSLCFVPDSAFFERLLGGGVSIILWPRQEMAQNEQDKLKCEVDEQKIGNLPEWLRRWRLRHWEETEKTTGPLSLLWDDPQRWPKDKPSEQHPDYNRG